MCGKVGLLGALSTPSNRDHDSLPVMNAPSPAKSFKSFSMHMSNGTPELCDSWNLIGKLVAREVFQAPYGCTLVLVPKAKTQVLVVASMGLEKTTSHCGLPYKP